MYFCWILLLYLCSYKSVFAQCMAIKTILSSVCQSTVSIHANTTLVGVGQRAQKFSHSVLLYSLPQHTNHHEDAPHFATNLSLHTVLFMDINISIGRSSDKKILGLHAGHHLYVKNDLQHTLQEVFLKSHEYVVVKFLAHHTVCIYKLSYTKIMYVWSNTRHLFYDLTDLPLKQLV